MPHAFLVLIPRRRLVSTSARVTFTGGAALRRAVGTVSALLIVVLSSIVVISEFRCGIAVMDFAGVHASALPHPLTADVSLDAGTLRLAVFADGALVFLVVSGRPAIGLPGLLCVSAFLVSHDSLPHETCEQAMCPDDKALRPNRPTGCRRWVARDSTLQASSRNHAYTHATHMATRRDFLSAGITSLLGAGVAKTTGTFQSPDQYLLAPGLVYLNTGSTGPSTQAVLDRTIAAWRQLESNPVRQAYGTDALLGDAEKVREQAASFLGCAADELMITRSTSEGMNTVAQSLRIGAGDRVLMTDQEHEGGTECWNYLAERRGVAVDKAAITAEMDDRAVLAAIASAITPATKVISVSHVLWTTGRRLPVTEISALARSRGLLCVVDGAQAAGGMPVNVKAIGCHAYATTGHKWMLGPKGLGLLYISAGAADAIKPVQWMAMKRFVGPSVGVGPLAAVMGLGVALEAARTAGLANIERHNLELRNRAYAGFMEMKGVRLMSGAPGSSSISALISVELPAGIVPGQFMQALLDKHRVQVKAIPRPFRGIRLSPHVFNTTADIDKALAAIGQELR